MSQVKLSVSLSKDDVATLDKYAKAAGLRSRSAALQQPSQAPAALRTLLD